MTSLKAEIEIIETKEREVDEQLLDLTHELEQYVSKVKENRQKIKHFENEVRLLLQTATIQPLCSGPRKLSLVIEELLIHCTLV